MSDSYNSDSVLFIGSAVPVCGVHGDYEVRADDTAQESGHLTIAEVRYRPWEVADGFGYLREVATLRRDGSIHRLPHSRQPFDETAIRAALEHLGLC